MTAFDHYLHAMLLEGGEIARADGSATIEAHHLLLAIAAGGDPASRAALAAVGLDHDGLRAALDGEFERSLAAVGVHVAAADLPRPGPAPDTPRMGASTRLALDRAFSRVARKKDLRPAHVLLGIAAAEVGTVPRALAVAGVDRAELLAHALAAATDGADGT
ncbi:Clp protease N-terminal domain-containing protein [Nocardiopsis trehalosi]|jgi:D-alanyl-D-alanine carboxypeptidase|uniref:Clp protease N-terminal domain-containing protein n=1 Tax=Nocardiopsis trehalosi TaxID=109329 RepID=UPI00082B6494|nr:Clp protease N-terminal domain-containing protein [Nocardiopsis trehalosi]